MFDELIIVLARTQQGIAALWLACASGRAHQVRGSHLPPGRQGGGFEFLKIALTDVVITSYEIDGTAEAPQMSSSQFSHAKIETAYPPVDATGKALSPVTGRLGHEEERQGLADVVRVRFAPSPTGSLHVGGALTAVANRALRRRARRRRSSCDRRHGCRPRGHRRRGGDPPGAGVARRAVGRGPDTAERAGRDGTSRRLEADRRRPMRKERFASSGRRSSARTGGRRTSSPPSSTTSTWASRT